MTPAFVYSTEFDFVLPEASGGPGFGNIRHFDGQRAARAWALACEEHPELEDARLEPAPVTEEELLSVHPPAYLASLASSQALAEVIDSPEIAQLPFDLLMDVILRPQIMGTGATLAATRAARDRGVVINLSGGYHHARQRRGEGFCLFSDIAIAAHLAREEHGVERIAVVDLDAHQGNGVSSIFVDDPQVGIFDIYNEDIYPDDLGARDGLRWDRPVKSGCNGAEYLNLLERELPRAFDEFDPEFVFYNAGTDLVAGDPLGRLLVDEADVRRRDAFVLDEVIGRGIPTVVTASGGYSELSHQLLARMIADLWQRTSPLDEARA